MFGRKPKLTVDRLFETAIEEESPSDYMKSLKEKIKATQEIVREHNNAARQKQKHYYDKKAKDSQFAIEDKVLVRVLAFKGRHKIADKFEVDVYTVIEQQNKDIPVFKVKSEKDVIQT